MSAVILVAFVVAACGAPGSGSAGSGALASGPAATDRAVHVVATTTVLADIVRNVGGDRVAVSSIVPAGAGPEDYEPRPDDARKLAGANLVVSNGVGLDDFLDKLIDAAGEGSIPRLVLGDGIPTITVDGEPNPHFWLDPTIVADHYVPAVVGRLGELDPDGATAYAANGEAYRAAIGEMDRSNATKLDAIAPADRKLVTFHDAFPYFARHYGFEVIGVILPNVGQEPSAKDLAALVDTVRSTGARAVFSESQFSPEMAKTLADEAGVERVVTTLFNDSVGPQPNDSYLAMMAWNVDRIVEALR